MKRTTNFFGHWIIWPVLCCAILVSGCTDSSNELDELFERYEVTAGAEMNKAPVPFPKRFLIHSIHSNIIEGKWRGYMEGRYELISPDLIVHMAHRSDPSGITASMSLVGLEWEEVKFFVNGTSVGTGEAGLERALSEIRQLSPPALVFFFPVSEGWSLPSDTGSWVAYVGGHVGKLCVKNKLDLICSYMGPRRPSDTKFGELIAHGEEVLYLWSIKEKPEMLLSWKGYNRKVGYPWTATYYLNGKRMGRGSRGFRKAVDAMRTFPSGATLLIYPGCFPALKRIPHVIDRNEEPPYIGYEGPLIRLIQKKNFRLLLAHEAYRHQRLPSANRYDDEKKFAQKFYKNEWMYEQD